MVQAIIDPQKCRPDHCPGGLCPVRKNCPTKAVWQEDPYDVPATDPGRCRGCSKCLAVCPLKAIVLV